MKRNNKRNLGWLLIIFVTIITYLPINYSTNNGQLPFVIYIWICGPIVLLTGISLVLSTFKDIK
jgi:hypothetical protein